MDFQPRAPDWLHGHAMATLMAAADRMQSRWTGFMDSHGYCLDSCDHRRCRDGRMQSLRRLDRRTVTARRFRATTGRPVVAVLDGLCLLRSCLDDRGLARDGHHRGRMPRWSPDGLAADLRALTRALRGAGLDGAMMHWVFRQSTQSYGVMPRRLARVAQLSLDSPCSRVHLVADDDPGADDRHALLLTGRLSLSHPGSEVVLVTLDRMRDWVDLTALLDHASDRDAVLMHRGATMCTVYHPDQVVRGLRRPFPTAR